MPRVEVLGKIDGPCDGYVTVLTRVRILPGEQVPRHTHPGIESTYILEGEGLVQVEGLPDKLCRTGDWFQVPAGAPHGVRIHPDGAVVLATYVVKKDQPLVTWL